MRQQWLGLTFLGIGWFLGGIILGGILGGAWLDKKYGTEPLFSILGLVLGLVLGGYGIYGMLVPILENRNKKKRQ